MAAEQLARLEKREEDLMKREEGMLLEKRSLAELKQRLESEQSTVKHEHEEVKSKLIELDHTGEQIKKEKERLSQIYFDLHALDGKSTGRLQQLQRSVTNLRQQEEQMSEVNQQIKFSQGFVFFEKFRFAFHRCKNNCTYSVVINRHGHALSLTYFMPCVDVFQLVP